ncbi:MAG: hypothetical protein IIC73_00055 [Armatimonadetes bacterium]|nr:hypothetical protein [Armatimonadota bacterium]
MSTATDDTLQLRPYGEIDATAPECGLRALPGRIAALTHPLNKRREIVLPDRELYDPDVCTVVSSGVEGFGKGDVVILAPDHGAYYPGLSPDGRECRIVGVVKPWWESVLAKFSADGVAPGPGWMLVDREGRGSRVEGLDGAERKGLYCWTPLPSPLPHGERERSAVVVLSAIAPEFGVTGTVVASCGDGWSSPYEGQRVCIQGLRTYTFREVAPKSWALVRAPIASKKWLSSLQRAI